MKKALLSTVLSLAVIGCSSNSPITAVTGIPVNFDVVYAAKTDLPGVETLAVTSLKGKDGDEISDQLLAAIESGGRYEVDAGPDIDLRLEGFSKETTVLSKNTLSALSEVTSAQAILIGYLDTDYDIRKESSKSTNADGDTVTRYRTSAKADAKGQLVVVDLETGKSIHRLRVSEAASDAGGGVDRRPKVKSKDELLGKVLEESLASMVQEITPYTVSEKLRFERNKDGNSEKAIELLLDNQLIEALPYFEAATETDMGDSSVWYNYALALAMNGDYDKAHDMMASAMERDTKRRYENALVKITALQTNADNLAKQLGK